jgi:hypothetical protein
MPRSDTQPAKVSKVLSPRLSFFLFPEAFVRFHIAGRTLETAHNPGAKVRPVTGGRHGNVVHCHT